MLQLKVLRLKNNKIIFNIEKKIEKHKFIILLKYLNIKYNTRNIIAVDKIELIPNISNDKLDMKIKINKRNEEIIIDRDTYEELDYINIDFIKEGNRYIAINMDKILEEK